MIVVFYIVLLANVCRCGWFQDKWENLKAVTIDPINQVFDKGTQVASKFGQQVRQNARNFDEAMSECSRPKSFVDFGNVVFNLADLNEGEILRDLMLKSEVKNLLVGSGRLNEFIKVSDVRVSVQVGKLSLDRSHGGSLVASLSVPQAVVKMEIFMHFCGIKWTIYPRITFSGTSATASMNGRDPQVKVDPGVVRVDLIDLNKFASVLNDIVDGEKRLADALKKEGRKQLTSLVTRLMKKKLAG